MAEVDGHGERRRGLEGTLERIARQLRSGRAVLDDEPWPRAMIIGVDTPERAEELRQKWGVEGLVWLPPIDGEEPTSGAR